MLIVPGRPSAQALLWWVWSDVDVTPTVTISGPAVGQSSLRVLRLGEASDPLVARRAYVVLATALQADAPYTLEAVAGNDRAQAASRTFPLTLEPGRPFTIAFGSCFSLPTNRGIDVFYPPTPIVPPATTRSACGSAAAISSTWTCPRPAVRHSSSNRLIRGSATGHSGTILSTRPS